MLQVLAGLADDHFERTDFVTLVLLVVAYAADYAVL